MSHAVVLKQKQTQKLPRHVQSHAYLGSIETRAGQAPAYHGCMMLASKKKGDGDKRVEENAALAEAQEIREKNCEQWLNDMAESIKFKNSVPAHLAFETFAPHDRQPLSAIFSTYSGAAK